MGRGRGGFFAGNDDLIKECGARVPSISHTAPNAGQPDFQSRAEGIGKQDCRLEPTPEFSCGGKDRLARLDTNDLIDIAHPLPETGKLLGAEDGDAGIGAAELECAHGGYGHHGVSEPVWRAQDDAEWCGIWLGVRQVDTPLGFADEEVGKRGLPAVMNPEPIRW